MARGNTDYESMTVEELHEEARRRGIGGTSHMRKDELIQTIRGDTGERRDASSGARGGQSERDLEPTGDSKSIHYSQTVRSPGEHEEREGRSLVTRSHDVIRQWAEERGAKPATIRGTEHGNRLGVLRFNFPGYGEGGNLEDVDWDDWFATFDERRLNFIYQEHRTDGRQSNFFRLESPEREDA